MTNAPEGYRPGHVRLGTSACIPAFLPLDGRNWNGFALPIFDPATLTEHRATLETIFARDNDVDARDGYVLTWDDSGRPHLEDLHYDDGQDEVVDVEIGGTTYIVVGGGFVWEEVEPRVFEWEDGFTPYSARLVGDTLTEYAGDIERDPGATVERRATLTRRPEWDDHANADDYMMSDDFSAGEVEGEAAVWIDGLGYSLTPIA
jgi:hypothetical protein